MHLFLAVFITQIPNVQQFQNKKKVSKTMTNPYMKKEKKEKERKDERSQYMNTRQPDQEKERKES